MNIIVTNLLFLVVCANATGRDKNVDNWYGPVPFMPGGHLLLTVKGSSSVIVRPHLADNTLREIVTANLPSSDVGQVRVELDYPSWSLGWLQVTVDHNARIETSYEILAGNKLTVMPPGFGVQLKLGQRKPGYVNASERLSSVMVINTSEHLITISTCASELGQWVTCFDIPYVTLRSGEAVALPADNVHEKYILVRSTGAYACFTIAKDAVAGNIHTFDTDSKITFGPPK